MPKLSTQTVTLLDGDLRLFKRDRSRAWQATFKIDGRWVRVSTKCRQLDDAKKRARELYVEYQVRQKNGLPVISKRFADVGAVTIAEMDKQLEAGAGKKSYRDYKIVLERYFIPYFGDRFITSITYEDLQQFAKWREHKMGHDPRASTLTVPPEIAVGPSRDIAFGNTLPGIGWGHGVLEGARRSLPEHATSTVLGPQDRECAEQVPEIHAADSED